MSVSLDSKNTESFQLIFKLDQDCTSRMKIQYFDKNNKVINTIQAEAFNQTTKFILPLPPKTRAVEVYHGAYASDLGATFLQPLAGQVKSLQTVKVSGLQSVYLDGLKVTDGEVYYPTSIIDLRNRSLEK